MAVMVIGHHQRSERKRERRLKGEVLESFVWTNWVVITHSATLGEKSAGVIPSNRDLLGFRCLVERRFYVIGSLGDRNSPLT